MVTAPTARAKQRLDIAVVERGLVETRSRARALILAGDVLLNGIPHRHAGTPVSGSDDLELKAKPRFVSRGGDKLDHAIDEFGVHIAGSRCADIGASTGGFTDCLLQRGAACVYAIDVGYGQLDARLRSDSRVLAMERVNARFLESLPEPIDVVVIDASFISLKLLFPVAVRLLRDGGICIPLIKPQFEAGRNDVGKGGVVKDPAIHRRVLELALEDAAAEGLTPRNLTRSPLVGPSGNVEFLALLERSNANAVDPAAVSSWIDRVVQAESEQT